METGPHIEEHEDHLGEGRSSGLLYMFCQPRGSLHRFVVLIFLCLLGFGSYFCYDNPASLEDHIKEDLNLSTSQYTLLYSMYSWPNVVLCFIGGFLIDRVFGIRLGANIYVALTFIGHLIYATGFITNTFWLSLVGRFIFGIGAESLSVAQNNYAVLWFKGKELNMVFGLQISFARIGTTVNFQVMEPIYDWVTAAYPGFKGLGIASFVAGASCIISMSCALIMGILDKRAERAIPRHSTSNHEVVKLTDAKDFKLGFWLISAVCVSYYIAVYPFTGLAKEFFTDVYNLSSQEANTLSGLVYLISAGASPIMGLVIDKIGMNVYWICLAVVSTILAHGLLGFATSLTPYVGIVIMGLSYSCLASSLWPLVSHIVPQHQLGTAYGVCQAVQNLGLAVFQIVAGVIAENYGYTWLEVFFLCSLIVALVGTILLWLIDLQQHGRLNLSAKARSALVESIKNMELGEKLGNSEAGPNIENSLQTCSDVDNRH